MKNLPNELLVEIFKDLNDDEQKIVSFVNAYWNALFSAHLARQWAVRKIEKFLWPMILYKRNNIYNFSLYPVKYVPSGWVPFSRVEGFPHRDLFLEL